MMDTLWNGPLPDPEIRRVEEMRGVLADPECDVLFPLYFMYRDCAANPADRKWLEAQGVRFDITVMPAASLCGEWIKTKGHHHPPAPDGKRYPELYQVLSGSAYYLLQNEGPTDVVVVPARGGEAVLVPPGYGHVTINAGTEPMVMANLVSRRFQSDYRFYEKMRGAPYYCLEKEGWVKNPAYEDVPPLKTVAPKEFPAHGIVHDSPIYGLVGSSSLGFLNAPGAFSDLSRWW